MNTDPVKVAILPIGFIGIKTMRMIQRGLHNAFPKIECMILNIMMPFPEDTYNPLRRQYYSGAILEKISDYTRKHRGDYFLGVINVDLYVPHLNFIFGEARSPGRVAIISLFRLKQEFYGFPQDEELFFERATKEAVHEIGHAFGLNHCKDPLCVMFFSNSIEETDRKGQKLCEKCRRLTSNIL